MKNSKPLMVLTVSLIIVFLFSIIIYLVKTSDENSVVDPTVTPIVTETATVTPTAEAEHNLQLEIISPEEEIILKGQARMYNAFVTGNTKYTSVKVNCAWKFYLNENNEEVLYKEMNNTSIMGEDPKDICGFTSTFMDKIGTVRVELTANLSNFAGDELESVSAERTYIVQ